MATTSRRFILKSSATAVAATAMVGSVAALSVAQEVTYTADDLKSDKLTPFGAMRAGNADGSIPAWTGGYSTQLPGYSEGNRQANPFPGEKPLFSITSDNLSQYKDKLTNGVIGLFQKRPDFRVDVYPTHRTAIAPQWVYDNIYKNAGKVQLSAEGNSITGAYGGIPFPLPKNGHEVIWNHLLSWQGVNVYMEVDAHFITAGGELVLESRSKVWNQFPYYFENGESEFGGFYQAGFIVPIAPPYEAGGSILIEQPVNPDITPPEGWIYLEGQRRTRRAPELQYDTPQSLTGGTENWDEVNIFAGRLNEYDFNYLGVKEMYAPYNSNLLNNATAAEQMQPHFVNPDLLRWELHRFRVVEMTLKPGARNVDTRRLIYCDEDTGAAIMGEVYDAQGALWKFQHSNPCIYPDVPCVNTFQFFCTYDLHAGDYAVASHFDADTQPQWKVIPPLPASFFSPGNLAASAQGF